MVAQIPQVPILINLHPSRSHSWLSLNWCVLLPSWLSCGLIDLINGWQLFETKTLEWKPKATIFLFTPSWKTIDFLAFASRLGSNVIYVEIYLELKNFKLKWNFDSKNCQLLINLEHVC